MNYNELSGKSILLLGKTRSLNKEEFETLLRLHHISVVTRYDDEVALIIEGRLMNPLEQDESARLYENDAAPIVSIEPIEQWLCSSIEPNRLLMSLKLSRDQKRLVDFIQNPYITNELFFKLLKLYDWQGEGLFDNDTNRDVTAAIIGRFYENIERNHNVQYAMSGLAHLIERYGTAVLIEAISELAPIAQALKNGSDRSLGGVFDAMALNPNTPETILRSLLDERSELIAHRIPLALEEELLGLNEEKINRILAQNESLSEKGANQLEAHYPERIARFTLMSEERFDRMMEKFAAALGSNRTLTAPMQQKLYDLKERAVYDALAANPAIDNRLLEQLYGSGGCREALATNPALSPKQCEALWMEGNHEVLNALSANPSTPVEILYQLALDRRYERSVKTNPSFGKHIQTHNIGWQV